MRLLRVCLIALGGALLWALLTVASAHAGEQDGNDQPPDQQRPLLDTPAAKPLGDTTERAVDAVREPARKAVQKVAETTEPVKPVSEAVDRTGGTVDRTLATTDQAAEQVLPRSEGPEGTSDNSADEPRRTEAAPEPRTAPEPRSPRPAVDPGPAPVPTHVQVVDRLGVPPTDGAGAAEPAAPAYDPTHQGHVGAAPGDSSSVAGPAAAMPPATDATRSVHAVRVDTADERTPASSGRRPSWSPD